MKKKSATKQELQIKLNSIRSHLVWAYGYHFKNRLEALKNHDMNDFSHHDKLLLDTMSMLSVFFGFDYKTMLDSLDYRQ